MESLTQSHSAVVNPKWSTTYMGRGLNPVFLALSFVVILVLILIWFDLRRLDVTWRLAWIMIIHSLWVGGVGLCVSLFCPCVGGGWWVVARVLVVVVITFSSTSAITAWQSLPYFTLLRPLLPSFFLLSPIIHQTTTTASPRPLFPSTKTKTSSTPSSTSYTMARTKQTAR